MSIKDFTTENGVIVISLDDRLDAKSAPDAQRQIDKILDENAGDVLLDCSNTSYVSSAGLRVFISTSKKLKAKQRRMALCCLSENVSKVFAISGFTVIFDIFAAREEAIEKFM